MTFAYWSCRAKPNGSSEKRTVSAAPNIHSASILKTMWKIPPCRNMYVASCQTHSTCSGGNGDGAGMIQAGCSPSTVVMTGNAICATNVTTLIPISALSAVEIGPGPKENDD